MGPLSRKSGAWRDQEGVISKGKQRRLQKLEDWGGRLKMATTAERIQIEPLDVDNYGEWSSQMQSYLTFLGLYDAIEKPNSEEGK
jgi:hypothetical protein